jgi:hypothetical protein
MGLIDRSLAAFSEWMSQVASTGGTSSFLAESLSPFARSLGEKTAELSGVSPFRLWPGRFSGRWVIRIGFKRLVIALLVLALMDNILDWH